MRAAAPAFRRHPAAAEGWTCLSFDRPTNRERHRAARQSVEYRGTDPNVNGNTDVNTHTETSPGGVSG